MSVDDDQDNGVGMMMMIIMIIRVVGSNDCDISLIDLLSYQPWCVAVSCWYAIQKCVISYIMDTILGPAHRPEADDTCTDTNCTKLYRRA
jgi:hypothetical protein